MNRSALFGGWLYRNDMGYPGEVDARGKGEPGNGRRRRLLGLRWSDDARVGGTRGAGWEGRGRRTCGTVEGWFGKAMNISPAHLFMQYFALAALRRLPPASLSLFQPPPPPPPLPPCRSGYPVRPDKYGGGPYTSDNILRLSVFELFRGNLRRPERRCRRQREETGGGSI